jgi:hypothetical protein
MTPLTMLPLVGVAAGVLGRGLSNALSDSLSFAASLRQGEAEEEQPAACEPANLAASEQTFQAALDRFRDHLASQLTAAGVNLSGPIELQSDGLGGVQVAGDHPQRAQIEQAISGNFSLQQEFQALSGQYAGLHPQFDPQHSDFGLLLAGDRLQVAIGE